MGIRFTSWMGGSGMDDPVMWMFELGEEASGACVFTGLKGKGVDRMFDWDV